MYFEDLRRPSKSLLSMDKEEYKKIFINLFKSYEKATINMDQFSIESGKLLHKYIDAYGLRDEFVSVLENASEFSYYAASIDRVNKLKEFYLHVSRFCKLSK